MKLLSPQQIQQQINALEERKTKLEALIELRAKVAKLDLETLDMEFDSRKAMEVIEVVCASFQTTVAALRGRKRHSQTVLSRHIAMWLVMQLTEITSVDCGTIFLRDHGTVFHAVKHIQDLIDTDPSIRKRVESLKTIAQARLQ